MKAEAAISTVLRNDERDGDWRIASRDASSLEEILALHDEQLGNAPPYHIVEADKRLRAFVMGSQPSPLKRPTSFDRFDRVVTSNFFASAVLQERRGPRLAGIIAYSEEKFRYALLFENKTSGCYEAPSPIIVDSLFMAESPNL